jgi:hypothetical protein
MALTQQKQSKFIQFLQEDLAIAPSAIAMAVSYREQNPRPLPTILRQYGLVTMEQLDQIYSWLGSPQ